MLRKDHMWARFHLVPVSLDGTYVPSGSSSAGHESRMGMMAAQHTSIREVGQSFNGASQVLRHLSCKVRLYKVHQHT